MPQVQADASLQLSLNAKDNAGGVIDHLGATLDTFRSAIGAAGLAAAGAFANSIQPTTQYADVLERVMSLTGLAAGSTAKLLAGFAGSAIGADQAASIIQKLSMRLGTLADSAAAAGTKGNAATLLFDRLGISIRDAHGNALPMTTLMPEIIDALNRIQDPLERARVASQLFGRNFAELAPVLANGGQGFKNAMGDAQRFGLLIGQDSVDNVRRFHDEQSRLNEALLGLQMLLGNYIIPYLTQAIIWFENVAATIQSVIAPVKDLVIPLLALVALFGTLLGGASAIAGVMTLVASTMGPVGAMIIGITTPFLSLIAAIGVVVAVLILLNAAYQRSVEAHRLLAPVVKDIADFFNRAKDAFEFFRNSISVIGPVNALGGALTILGFSTQQVLPIMSALQSVLGVVSGVVATVQDAFRSMTQTWIATKSPMDTLVAGLLALGVNMGNVQAIVGALRLVSSTLQADWSDLVKATLPALQSAMITLAPVVGQIQAIFQRLLPVFELVAAIIVGTLLGAIQVLIRIFIAVLPPAIEIVAQVIAGLVGMIDTASKTFGNMGAIMGVVNAVLGILKTDWENFVKGVLPALKDAMVTLAPAIAQVGNIFQQSIPIFMAVSAVMAILIGVGFQVLVTVLTNVLPPAIRIAADALKAIVDVVEIVVRSIGGMIRIIGDLIHGDWRKAWADFMDMRSAVIPLMADFVKNIMGILGTLIAWLSGLLGQLTNPFVAAFQNWLIAGLKSLVDFITGIGSAAQGIGNAIMGGIIQPLAGLAGRLFSALGSGASAILQAGGEWFANAARIGNLIILGIISIIQWIATPIAQWALGVITQIAGFFAPFLAAAQSLGNAVWHGIIDIVNTIAGVAQTVLLSLAGTVLGLARTFSTNALAIGNSVWHGVIDPVLTIGVNIAAQLLAGAAIVFGLARNFLSSAAAIGHSIFTGIMDIVGTIAHGISTSLNGLLTTLSGFIKTFYAGAAAIGGAILHGIIDVLAGLGGALNTSVQNAIHALPGPAQTAIHAIGLAEGAVVGPGFGGPRYAMVGEGTETEVVAKASQLVRAGMLAGGNAGGGGGTETIIVPLVVDGATLAKIVLKRAGDKWKLQAGNLGSGA